ncbi:hypothetical protein CWN85_01415 [Vibrio splendidus]|nr:hypothetical protein CWN86_00965 [Vibrio splendidus]PTP26544.1 hypothetical protein CWN85_01415 [Vibrio splendidus]
MLFEGLNRTTHNFLLWVEIALRAEIVSALRLHGVLRLSFGIEVIADGTANQKRQLIKVFRYTKSLHRL